MRLKLDIRCGRYDGIDRSESLKPLRLCYVYALAGTLKHSIEILYFIEYSGPDCTHDRGFDIVMSAGHSIYASYARCHAGFEVRYIYCCDVVIRTRVTDISHFTS